MWRTRLLALQSGAGSGGGGRDLSPQIARMHTDRALSKAPTAVGLAAVLGAGSASQAACDPSVVLSAPAGKPYLARPGLADAFTPMLIAKTLACGALDPFVAQMNAAMRRLTYARSAGRVKGETHDENGARLTPFALIKWDTLRKDMFFNCVKKMAMNVLISASQLALWHCLDGEEGQRVVAKFIKNLGDSAERKSLRMNAAAVGNSSSGNIEAASSIMYTYVRGAVLGWTVYHAVEFCWGCFSLPRARSFRENLRDAARMPMVLCTGACGAAVGTIVWPGYGTRLGALGGEMLPDLICPACCGTPIQSDIPPRRQKGRKSRNRRKQHRKAS